MDAQSKGKGKERSLDDAEEGGQVAVVSMLGPLGTYTHQVRIEGQARCQPHRRAPSHLPMTLTFAHVALQAARRFMDGSKTRYEMEERITGERTDAIVLPPECKLFRHGRVILTLLPHTWATSPRSGRAYSTLPLDTRCLRSRRLWAVTVRRRPG